MKCTFVGRMEEQILAGLPAVLEVSIAQEEAAAQASPTMASSTSDSVDAKATIDVRVFVRGDLQPLTATEMHTDPPVANAPRTLLFTLRPRTVGQSEVVVMLTQGPTTLGSLMLRPQIVATRGGSDRLAATATGVADAEPPAEVLPQLQVFQVRDQRGLHFTYSLDLTGTPDGLITGQTPGILGNVDQYVAGIYANIERTWSDNQNDYTQFTEDLRTYGATLFTELFDEKLQAALWRNRQQIKGINVFSTEPFIPWELVHMQEPGKSLKRGDLRFLGQMGLVRWLMDRPGAPKQLVIRPGRARYITPTYDGAEGFNKLDQPPAEAEFLTSTFKAKPVVADVAPVRKLLMDGGFDLLHFSGHGSGDAQDLTGGRIILQGSRTDANTNTEIANSLEPTFVAKNANIDKRGARPMIVLNACQVGRQRQQLTSMGGFADAFIQRGAGAFVGTLWSVLDDSARTFVEELYRNLLQGQPIARASAGAREKARKADDATWLAYVVYADPHARLVVQR